MTREAGRQCSLTIAALLALYAIVLLRTAWLSDDAYITFRTIDNFVGGYGMRWNPAERVQSFTHPLWMLLLSGAYAVTREIYLTAVVSSVALSLSTVALLGWYARRIEAHPFVLAAGLGILLVSRAFVDYSTSGLENPLTHLLLVALVALFLDERESPKKLFSLGLLAGLGMLNRMDTAILFLPPLAWELWRSRNWKAVPPVLLGLTPFLSWQTFSVIYYGFPFPNTAYAKLRTGLGRFDYWDHGLGYFANSLARDPVTLLAITAGMIVGLVRPSGRRLALVASVLLYAIYIIHIGGDFMSGRFFTAPLLVSVLLLLDAGSHLHAPWPRRLLPVAVVLVGSIGTTPTLLSGRDCGRVRHDLVDNTGVADERAYYYPMTGLLGDTPLADRPRGEASEAGRNARLHDDPLMVEEAVGFGGFLAGPKTHVVDYHALGDPLRSRLPMVRLDPFFSEFCVRFHGRPCTGSWRTGHYLRNVPAGYLDSILADDDRLVDENLHKFYEPIRLITRGPIWSRERWIAIAKMNFGLYDSLLEPIERVDYRPIPFAETYERYPDARSVSLLNGAAHEYLERGAQEPAIECYRKLVAIDASADVAWTLLGLLLLRHGDAAGGEVALLESIKLQGNHLEPYVSLGDLMETTGRGSEASELFQQLADAGDKMAAEYLRLKNGAR